MTDYINTKSDLLDEYSPDKWLLPHEVAELFGVDTKTVSRWVSAGKLDNVRMFKTPGGHFRYLAEDIHSLLELLYENS